MKADKTIKPYRIAEAAAKFMKEQDAPLEEEEVKKFVVWTPESLKSNLEAREEYGGDGEGKILKSFNTFEEAMAYIDAEFSGFALVDTFAASVETIDEVDIYPIDGDPSFASQMSKLGKVADDFNKEMGADGPYDHDKKYTSSTVKGKDGQDIKVWRR